MAHFNNYIVLEYIHCYKTEDSYDDEIYLIITLDGSPIENIGVKKMNKGDVWNLSRSISFNSSIKITMMEYDRVSSDDNLGSCTLDGSSGNSGATFNLDHANYYLKFTVINNPPPTSVDKAKDIADSIVNNGYWPTIPLANLIAAIRSRIDAPAATNQSSTPFCGPAAILYWLDDSDKETYAKLCKELYETGKFVCNNKTFQPRLTLRNSAVPAGMNLADWMMMATLRDVYNEFYEVSINMPDVGGISWPGEMVEWTNILLGRNAKFESAVFGGEFELMITANTTYHSGGVGFMVINADLIKSGVKSYAYPNHWVTFLPPLSVHWGQWYKHDSGSIEFNCQSWGDFFPKTLDEGSFEAGFWGLVYG